MGDVMNLFALSRAFGRATSGNTATLFGLSVVPVAVVAAGAIELNALESARAEMQNATDVAALTAASLTDDTAQVRAQAVFDAAVDGRSGLNVVSRNAKPDGDGYRFTAQGTFDLGVGGLLGLKPVTITTTAKAARHMEAGAEIAIVHDATKSMGFGGRWSDAVGAVEAALKVMQSSTKSDAFHVAYIPYSDRVNIGPIHSAWLRLEGQDPVADDDDQRDGFERADWSGCVEPREGVIGAFEYALDDVAPVGEDRFWPSAEGYYGALQFRSKRSPKCGQPIQEPTANIEHVVETLKAVEKEGTGRWDVGLAWGWRALSPQWRGHWKGATDDAFPKDYGDGRKLLFFIVDGNSTAYDYEVGADPNSYGHNNGTKMGWAHVVDLCERIKATGIELHVLHMDPVAYQTGYMEACATTVQNHYHVVEDLESWKAAFQFAAGQFSSVRLVD